MDITDKILQSQLNNLVALSSQGDMDHLIETFVHNIKYLFSNGSIILITSHGPKALNQLAFTAENLKGTVDNVLHKAGSIKTVALPGSYPRPGTVIKQDARVSWIQIPLMTHIGVIGFLQIAGQHPPKYIIQAEAHIELFLNLVNILGRNERDTLTGMYHRQTFERRLNRLIENKFYEKRKEGSFVFLLAFVQLDRYKEILEGQGHLYADEMTVVFSRLIKDTMRDEDWVFFYQKDRLVLLLEKCDLKDGARVVERVRKRVNEFCIPEAKQLSCSIGYTALVNSLPLATQVARIEAALAHASARGGDQCHAYEQLIADGTLTAIEPGVEADSLAATKRLQ